MVNIIKKLCLLIAASDITENQLKEVCNWININGAEQIEIVVSKIRTGAKNAVMESIVFPKSKAARLIEISNEVDKLNDSTNAYNQVVRLLRLESNLSASSASEMLIAALEKSDHHYNTIIPRLGKKSFRQWVDQIAKIIPYSVILHNATKIRNSIVHRPKSDWPLRK